MKKPDKIFLILIAIQILIILVLYLFFKNPCGSACDNYSLLNPFGIGEDEVCISVCTETLHPLTYLFADTLIITLIIYTIYFFKTLKQMKGGKKNGSGK